MTPALATRHACPHRVSARCGGSSGFSGRPTRKTCPACGGQWVVLRGVYGVFVHSSVSGSARYALEDAERTFTREAAAEAWRAAQDPEGVRLVARFTVAR